MILKIMCYYFDYTMGIIDINFRNILLDQKKKKKKRDIHTKVLYGLNTAAY